MSLWCYLDRFGLHPLLKLLQSESSILYGSQDTPPSPLSCKIPPRHSLNGGWGGGQLLIARDFQPYDCTVQNLKTRIRWLSLGVYCKSAMVSLMIIYTKFYLFKYTFSIVSLNILFRKIYFMLFSLCSPNIAHIVIATCVNHKEVIVS